MIFVFVQLLYVVPSMVYIKFLLVALTCGKYAKLFLILQIYFALKTEQHV